MVSKPDTEQKLKILSADAQYDLACACSTDADESRKRGTDGRWIYPVTLPNGGKSVLFKTLISNVCHNDCKYGFTQADVPIDTDGFLDLSRDPKQVWADQHPEFFPLVVHDASRQDLLKVPGLGPIAVRRILQQRQHTRLRRLEDLGRVGVRLRKAKNYLTF